MFLLALVTSALILRIVRGVPFPSGQREAWEGEMKFTLVSQDKQIHTYNSTLL